MCRELHAHREWLWTFLDTDGVEPTNNAAERSLRQAVIWRKLSFGTQSAGGSRYEEMLLSVIETCRQQERSVLDHVTSAVTAHFHGRPGLPAHSPRASSFSFCDSAAVLSDRRAARPADRGQ